MNRMKRRAILQAVSALLTAVFFVFPQNARAKVFEGISFPDQALVAQKPCILNGIGVRTKFMMNIYFGALYLQEPSKNQDEIIKSEEPKRVLLHIVYKQVDPDKWVEGWQEGFSKNTPQPDASLKEKMAEFIKCFKEPVKKGEEVQIDYVPGTGTEVRIKGRLVDTIPGADFMRALWSIWFGQYPASEPLMKGMLGK